jgi:hypothetical protein
MASDQNIDDAAGASMPKPAPIVVQIGAIGKMLPKPLRVSSAIPAVFLLSISSFSPLAEPK